MTGIEEGVIYVELENSMLGDIAIEIIGKDAFSVGASLELGGLATKHIGRKGLIQPDSAIMKNALRKLGS